jgi:hypothetical protein
MVARSSRNPSAINSFAITNIGPSSKCEGLSTSAGCRRSNTWWPTICKVTPVTTKTAVAAQIADKLKLSTINPAVANNRTAATTIAAPSAASSASQ